MPKHEDKVRGNLLKELRISIFSVKYPGNFLTITDLLGNQKVTDFGIFECRYEIRCYVQFTAYLCG